MGFWETVKPVTDTERVYLGVWAIVFLALAVLFLAACGTTMPADPTKMSAEQLKEWVKDKNAYVTCASTKNMGGNITLMSANLDKGTVIGGSVTVSPDCTTTITSEPKKAP